MQNPMNPSGASRVLPVLDLLLLIVLCTFGTGGLSWIADTQSEPVDVSRSTSLMEMRRQLTALEQDVARREADDRDKERRIEAIQKTVLSLRNRRNELEALQRKNMQAAERERQLKEQIERQTELNARMVQERKGLTEQWEHLKMLRDEMSNMKVAIRQTQAASASLTSEIESILKEAQDRPVIRVESTPLVSTDVLRAPVYVALVDGGAAPVREPYYRMEKTVRDCGNGRYEMTISAVPEGGRFPVSPGLQDAPELRQLLASLNPKKQYIAMLLDPASFAAFRVLRREVREAGIPFGWEPCSSKVLQFCGMGQIVGEEK